MSSSDNNASDRDRSPADDVASPIASSHRGRSSEVEVQNGTARENGINGSVSPQHNAASQDEGGEGDLFGEEGSQAGSPPIRKLDDAELDSGDDEDRRDRVVETVESENIYGTEQEQLSIMELTVSRVAQPEAGDGELYFFHTPTFLAIDQFEFDPETYETPKTEHHSRMPPKEPSKFSSFNIASTKIHWRHSLNSGSLESNSRIIRWSDGSLTLQMASNPREQYSVPAKPLSAPQINPRKPTPLSINLSDPSSYQPTGPNPESNTYLATPITRLGMLRNIAHFTTSITPLPNTLNEDADSAISMLRDSLAATRRLSAIGNAEVDNLIGELEDPEKARREAEALEKEKLRAERRSQNAKERAAGRDARAMGRVGMRSGLTVAQLEAEDGMPTTTKSRSKASAAAVKRRRAANRRGDIYSDDDDGYGARGRTREDEYDVDDGFLVGSDEEEEEEAVDDDEEDDLDAEGEDETPPPKPAPKQTLVRGSPTSTRVERPSPKRDAAAVDDEDEDGAGAVSGQGRAKRRMVIDDDEEE